MLTNDLCQVRSNDRGRIYYCISQTLRTFSLSFRDPDRWQVERRLKSRDSCDLFLYIPGIHGHIMVKQYLSLTDLNSLDFNNILIRVQLNIIPQSDNRYHRTKFQCYLSSDHHDTIQQVTTLVHIRQRDNSVTEFQFDRIHLQQAVDIFRLSYLLRSCFLTVYFLFNLCRLNRALNISRHNDKYQAKTHEQDRVQLCHKS